MAVRGGATPGPTPRPAPHPGGPCCSLPTCPRRHEPTGVRRGQRGACALLQGHALWGALLNPVIFWFREGPSEPLESRKRLCAWHSNRTPSSNESILPHKSPSEGLTAPHHVRKAPPGPGVRMFLAASDEHSAKADVTGSSPDAGRAGSRGRPRQSWPGGSWATTATQRLAGSQAARLRDNPRAWPAAPPGP